MYDIRELAAVLVIVLVTGCSSQISKAAASPSPFAYATPSGRTDNQWTTFMGDSMRTGIGPGGPLATNAHRTWTAPVDGDVYASPLVVGSSLIVASQQNSVYALDVSTGAVRWRTRLGSPVPLAELECGNITINGITSTPVADPASGLVYVVAFLNSPARHELFALRLSDGGIAWRRPADAPNADPGHHQQRGALNLAGGHIYVTYGGFTGDCGMYHGTVVRVASDGRGPLDAWVVPSQNGAGIWSPAGPVIDAKGDVWVTTGNTDLSNPAVTERNDWSQTVIRLDPQLTQPGGHWWPANWAALNQDDVDLGSSSPALLPGDLVFIAGKEGVGYLLRARHMDTNGQAYAGVVCRGGPTAGAFGAAAVAGGMIFVPCKDGLAGIRLNASVRSFSVAWHAAQGTNSPVIAYGLVWTVAADPFGYRQAWKGALVGVDPSSGLVRAQVELGDIPHFPSPAAAAGSLYVGGRGMVFAVAVT